MRTITIQLPGSKSYTNRALLCAALSHGKTRLFRYTPCEDTEYMVDALGRFGVKIKKGRTALELEGGVERLRVPRGSIDVANAGTTMRFLVTFAGFLVAKKGGEVILTGSRRMQERPIQDLLDALQVLRIGAESVRKNGCPPIRITNSESRIKKQGGEVTLRGAVSSQYLSSILLCAPYFDCDAEIKIAGELASKPYALMTVEVMKAFGVKVMRTGYRVFKVAAGQKYHAEKYEIEPDASSASYFMAGAIVTGQAVSFPGLPSDSKQGDVRFKEVLSLMQKSKIKGELHGVTVDMNTMPDMVPTLAVLAMFAKGKTVIKNVPNLRLKETDRIVALVSEIRKFGVKVQERKDGLIIIGNPEFLGNRETVKRSKKISIRTYGDHRMAMAFAIAKLVFPGILIENPACVAKSFPGFWKEWGKLVAYEHRSHRLSRNR